MNRIADARQLLLDALSTVLDGRVNGYPLTRGARHVAPYTWIDQPTVVRETRGRSTFVVATFPVSVIYDGADHAQVAGLDETVARIWDVCEVTPGVEPVDAVPIDRPVDNGITLRGCDLRVAVVITSRTLCPPDVSSAAIPPPVVEATAVTTVPHPEEVGQHG